MERGMMLMLGVVALVCLVGQMEAGPVVGIDIGSSWSKVAMIQGQNLDLVLDETGARRRNTWVGIRGDERVFGRDAERMLMRFPTNVFKNIIDMVGKPKQQLNEIGEQLPFLSLVEPTLRNSTNIVLPPLSDEEEKAVSFLPEELLAMFFQQALKVASAKAGIKVVDCVVVVPNYFTHHQRQALLDAAKIADANVLGLMNVGTAAALTYGLNRDKETVEQHQRILFYDMGSGSTKVSVVEFKMVEDHKKNKTVPLIQTVGHGWDETLGGREFDLRVAKFFGRLAESRMGAEEGKVLNNKRTMQRLLREAKKSKEVLSANQEAYISIPDLVPDFDFQASITRKQFEEETKDLLERVTPPINQALLSASLNPSDIDEIEVIGGGVRIPEILKRIGHALDHETVGRHLNGDEAAVFGAAFYAATQSTSFRVKSDIRLKDATAYAVDVEVEGVELGGKGEGEGEKALLFKALNRFGAMKKLSFGVGGVKEGEEEKEGDFLLRLIYNSSNDLSDFAPQELTEFVFSGVPKKEEGEGEGEGEEIVEGPKVTLAFRLGGTGVIDVEKAEVEYTVMVEEKVVKEEEEKEEEEGEKVEEKEDGEEEEEKKEKEEEEEEEEKEEEVVEYVKVKKTKKKALKVEKKALGLKPMSWKNITDSKKKLRELDRLDKLKMDTEEARNSLEAFIYSMRERLYEDEEFLKFTNQPEIDDMFEALYEASEWLEDEGDDAKLEELRAKMKTITDKTNVVEHRKEEYEGRDQALINFLKVITKAKNETSNMTNSHEVEEEEMEEFLTFLKGLEEEVRELYGEALEKKLDEDPVLTRAWLEKRGKEVEGKVRRFKYRPKRKAKVVEEIVVEEKEEEEKEEEVVVEEEEVIGEEEVVGEEEVEDKGMPDEL